MGQLVREVTFSGMVTLSWKVLGKREPRKEADYLQEGSNFKGAARQIKAEQLKEKFDVI